MTYEYLQLRIRDLFWLAMVCALAVRWWQNSRRLQSADRTIQTLHGENRQLSTQAKSAQNALRELQVAIEVQKAEAMRQWVTYQH